MSIKKVEFRKEAVYEVPENQKLLQFQTYDDVEAFQEWWDAIGRDLFEDFLLDRNF